MHRRSLGNSAHPTDAATDLSPLLDLSQRFPTFPRKPLQTPTEGVWTGSVKGGCADMSARRSKMSGLERNTFSLIHITKTPKICNLSETVSAGLS